MWGGVAEQPEQEPITMHTIIRHCSAVQLFSTPQFAIIMVFKKKKKVSHS